MDEGWGLQTSADGKKAGHDVIVFGQPRGDIPELHEQHADQIADFVVDSGRSVVLSLLGFETDQSERWFVTAFFKRLYRRKSQLTAKTRTLVVLEEADLFCPEQASGANGDTVGAIKRIADGSLAFSSSTTYARCNRTEFRSTVVFAFGAAGADPPGVVPLS